MPANLSTMLRSLLKARQAASTIELSFLREVARTLPTAGTNGRQASKRTARTITRRRTVDALM